MDTFLKLNSVIPEWDPKQELHSPDVQGWHQELPGT